MQSSSSNLQRIYRVHSGSLFTLIVDTLEPFFHKLFHRTSHASNHIVYSLFFSYTGVSEFKKRYTCTLSLWLIRFLLSLGRNVLELRKTLLPCPVQKLRHSNSPPFPLQKPRHSFTILGCVTGYTLGLICVSQYFLPQGYSYFYLHPYNGDQLGHFTMVYVKQARFIGYVNCRY